MEEVVGEVGLTRSEAAARSGEPSASASGGSPTRRPPTPRCSICTLGLETAPNYYQARAGAGGGGALARLPPSVSGAPPPA